MAGQYPESAQPRLVVPDGDGPLLQSIRIPEGWKATILAEFPGAKPASIRATAEGHLFVSLQKEAAGDSATRSGRIVKLIGRNWAGKAGEIHEFVPHLDAPHGLEWDGDWLYVMNPPHLIAVRDNDGDQVADEDRVLVSGIPSGTGVTLGIDGWLYLSIGDDGFAEAKGFDGTTLQLRGGGIVRVRPDGSGLQLVSRGTCGISEVAVSPTLDVFARGSGNEDLGWDARLHHFPGLDHHGYPSLFQNFEEDLLPPVATYDVTHSSGGILILSEENRTEEPARILLTADSGHNRIDRHEIEPAGAGFREDTRTEMISIPHPADLDSDSAGRILVAGYRAEGTDQGVPAVGYIASFEPAEGDPDLATPKAAPTGPNLSNHLLIQQLREAGRNPVSVQRSILRRQLTTADLEDLETLAADSSASLESRIAALFTMKLGFGEAADERIESLAADADLLPFALRVFGDSPEQSGDAQSALCARALTAQEHRAKREAILAIARLDREGFVPQLAQLAVSPDPVLSHMSITALAELRQIDACFDLLEEFGNYKIWPGIFRGLGRVHEKKVVDGIISRLEKSNSTLFRNGALESLARLYYKQGTWDGEIHSPPDTHGPYPNPATWEGTPAIDSVIRKALRDKRVNKVFLFREISRNRIPYDDFKSLLSITAVTPDLEEPTVSLILEQEQPPPDSLPFLTFTATSEDRPADLRLRAAIALAQARDDMAAASAFRLTLERDEIGGIPRLRNELKTAVLENAFHEHRWDWLLEEAHGPADDAGILAWTILLQSIHNADPGPIAKREINSSIDRAIGNAVFLRRLLTAISELGHSPDEQIVNEALEHPDPSVFDAARKAAAALRADPSHEGSLPSH